MPVDNISKCFEAWLAEVRRADEAQDGGAYLALPVLEAIAEGRMPPSAGAVNDACPECG